MASDFLLQRTKPPPPDSGGQPRLDQAGLCAVSALLSGLATYGAIAWRNRGRAVVMPSHLLKPPGFKETETVAESFDRISKLLSARMTTNNQGLARQKHSWHQCLAGLACINSRLAGATHSLQERFSEPVCKLPRRSEKLP